MKERSRTKTSFQYLGFTYLGTILVVVQGIVLVPLYLRYIDEELYGAWLATGGALAYLSLLDLGFTAVIRQQVAEAFGRKENDRIATIVGTGFLITAVLSLAMMSVGVLVAFLLPQWLEIEGPSGIELTNSIIIAAIANGITLFAYSVSDVAIGLQRVIGVNLLNILAWILGIVANIYGLSKGWGLVSIPIGFLVRSLAYLLGLILNLVSIWIREVRVRPQILASQLRTMTGLASHVFVGRAAETIILRSDELVIARMLGTEFVTTYVLTSKAKDVVRTVPDRIGFVVVPGLASLFGEKGLGAASSRALQIFNITFGVTLLCAAGIVAWNGSFVELWVGSKYFGGMALTLAICMYFVFLIVRGTMSRLLFAIGEIRYPNWLLLCESVLHILLVVAFTKRLGLIGVPLGASLALIATNGVFLTRFFVRQFHIDKQAIFARVPGQIAFTIVAFGLALLTSSWVHPQNWLQFAVFLGFSGAILSLLLYVFNMDLRATVTQTVPLIVRRFKSQKMGSPVSSE